MDCGHFAVAGDRPSVTILWTVSRLIDLFEGHASAGHLGQDLHTVRLAALNRAIGTRAARHGVLLADIADESTAMHPGIWAPDRLHANEFGHERIAGVIAQTLGLPGADDSWTFPLPPLPLRASWTGLAGIWRGPTGRCCRGCSGTPRADISARVDRPKHTEYIGDGVDRRWNPDRPEYLGRPCRPRRTIPDCRCADPGDCDAPPSSPLI